MICTKCNAEMPAGSKVCGMCGEALESPQPQQISSQIDGANDSSAQADALVDDDTKKQKKKGKLKLWLAIAAAILVLLGGGLAFAHTQNLLPEGLTASLAVVIPQGLSEDFVEESLRDAGFENRTFAVGRAWADEGGYSDDAFTPISLQEGSYIIDSIEGIEIHENEDGNTASSTAQMTLSNDSLTVAIDVSTTYRRVDGRWILRDNNVDSVDFTPLVAIDESAIAARVQSYLAIFDSERATPSGGWGWSSTNDSDPSLATLYAGGDFSVTAELSHLDSGDYLTVAEVALENETHFYTVSGILSLTYRFDSEAAQWTIERSDMQLSDSAWDPDYSKLVGTWIGTYHSSEGTGASGFRCLGASGVSPAFVVQSIDVQNGTLSGTLSGLSHNHSDRLGRTINSHADDINFPATQFIADINIGHSSITFNRVSIIHNSERFGTVRFSGTFEFVDGSMQGTIDSTPYRGWTTYQDTFTFERTD